MNDDTMHSPSDRAKERLGRAVAALPREIEPTADLFPAIRARIDAARVVPLGAGDGMVPAAVKDAASIRQPRPWRTPLIAAAVVCAVAGSAIMIRAGTRTAPIAAANAVAPEASHQSFTPAPEPRAAASSIAADYQMASDDLERVLHARLDRLSPTTAQTIRRSLAAIDEALAETRAALEQDPSSRDLLELLDSVYRQKLTLLRRANALPLRTT